MLQVFFRADQKYDLGRTNMKKKKKNIYTSHNSCDICIHILYTKCNDYYEIYSQLFGGQNINILQILFLKGKKETGRVLSLILGCFSTEY